MPIRGEGLVDPGEDGNQQQQGETAQQKVV